jgi:hypothetical protein
MMARRGRPLDQTKRTARGLADGCGVPTLLPGRRGDLPWHHRLHGDDQAIEDRLAGDWMHSLLHLCSGLLGVYAGWLAAGAAPARLFTWGVGVLYLALGVHGSVGPGLLLGTPVAIPLGIADNLFHFALSLPALAVGLTDLARRRATA